MRALVAVGCGLLLCAAARAASIVRLDSATAGQAISPYIYGQFIEHLGRSIYGGIWAEMLQDRKFCYPITDHYDPWGVATDPQWGAGPYKFLKASPWKVIGPPGTVTMETAHPFVGEHSPQIHLGGNGSAAGISQDGLALVAGKKYTGHIVVAGDASAAPVIVQLVQDDGTTLTQTIDALTPDFQSYPLAFAAAASSNDARIQIISRGGGQFTLGTLSLMPADNVEGFRADTLALLKELHATVYRWPGGNFVSGYNWRDGVGDRDKRPPRLNPAWKGVEPNDVGIHEYMQLMHMLDAQPYVSLNTGLGTVQQAADEVEYFNGGPDTPLGKFRAANGDPLPFNVRFFAVGNEMFGRWQLGYMPEAEYVVKHNAVADAIWKISPDARLVAVGDVGPWDQMMLRSCSDHMNLLSEHVYVKQLPDLAAHTAQLAEQIKRVADAFRRDQATIAQMNGRNIRLVMDEWNYWYGNYIYGQLGVQYHLKDALGVARGLHEFFRDSDVYYMANYAQTVNVIGAIKTSRTAACLDTTGLTLVLYRNHFGTIPIPVTQEPAGLDVSAAWSADRSAVTVAIVNYTASAQTVTLDAGDLAFQPAAQQWILTGPGPESVNVPGKPPQVTLTANEYQMKQNALAAPPLSVAMYRLAVH
jgi:alpha-L-arabinofuranosidase